METPFTDADTARQLEWRGRYGEFTLLYDVGTLLGLRTGGNVDATLMTPPDGGGWGKGIKNSPLTWYS